MATGGSTAWLLLRRFEPKEFTFFRNFNKIVVKVEFVHVVYLRFYKALQRPSPESGPEERLVTTWQEVYNLRDILKPVRKQNNWPGCF